MTTSSGVSEANGSGTYRYRANQVHAPRTVAELQQLVRSGGRLHPLGTRHSFNGVADGDALVSVAGIAGSATIDSEARTVTVPAGMRYGDLVGVLHGHDPRSCTSQLGEPGPWCDRLPHFRLELPRAAARRSRASG